MTSVTHKGTAHKLKPKVVPTPAFYILKWYLLTYFELLRDYYQILNNKVWTDLSYIECIYHLQGLYSVLLGFSGDIKIYINIINLISHPNNKHTTAILFDSIILDLSITF